MTEYSLLDVYDAAKRRECDTFWMTYYGAHIGVSVEKTGDVFVWLADATDVDDLFDVCEMSAHEFLDAVAAFVTDHRSL